MTNVSPMPPLPWPPAWQRRVRATAFAFDEWQKHAQEAGSRLVALTADVDTRIRTQRAVKEMKRMTDERGIPVVDLPGHILDRGGDLHEAHWPYDFHWSPQGHLWAAEALLEWMAANPSVCAR